jgi:dipeptidyl aminopeptidase/acylaminoacyl peptidase
VAPPLAASAVAAVGTVAEPRAAPGGGRLAWVRATPLGPAVVVDGVAVPDLVPAGTRGAAYCWADAERLVVAGAGGLRTVRADGTGPGALLAPAEGRVAAPAVGAGLVAYVDETDTHCRIVVAPLDGTRGPRAVSTADWAIDPAWSPDGRLLAWHEWDEPDMPGDGSRIVVADLGAGETTVVAGGPGVAVGQPRFAPAGPTRLALVSDRDGWANCTVVTPTGTVTAVFAEAAEHAEPTWGPGQRSFAWSPDGTTLAWCRNEAGFGRLVAAAPGGPATGWGKGWHHGLDWGPQGLAAVRSGARTPPTVVVYAGDPPTRSVREVAVGADGVGADGFVEPTPVSWAAPDGAEVPGLWFAPPGGAADAPLLVHLHGGPTDQTRVEWALRLQYWVARGWSVLAPNPRGSTGYGRAHTRALVGGWGDLDVDDVLAGIAVAGTRGWGDPGRVALVGGSAGGYCALLAAVRAPDRIRAVATAYPVTDLHAVAATTWRFERHAHDTLIGPLPEAADRWRDRSPVTHAAALRCPVLVLQGGADRVVAPAQTAAFVEAVNAAGGRAELHVYPEEGHGWSRPAVAADALARTDDFLRRTVLAP